MCLSGFCKPNNRISKNYNCAFTNAEIEESINFDCGNIDQPPYHYKETTNLRTIIKGSADTSMSAP